MEEEQIQQQTNNSESAPDSTLRVEPVPPDYPGRKTFIRGEWYRQEDHEAAMRQVKAEDEAERARRERQNWEQSGLGEMCLDLFDQFQAYKEYLKNYPSLCKDWMKFKEHRLFVRALKWAEHETQRREEIDRKNLEKAQLAERCEHIHANGARCGSPKMNGSLLCYKHRQMEEARPMKLDLGTMEDT